jgi:hypothetical protein
LRPLRFSICQAAINFGGYQSAGPRKIADRIFRLEMLAPLIRPKVIGRGVRHPASCERVNSRRLRKLAAVMPLIVRWIIPLDKDLPHAFGPYLLKASHRARLASVTL